MTNAAKPGSFRISAVLLSWKRQYHLPDIVNTLRECPLIDDITIWQNELEATPQTRSLGATVMQSETNYKTYGRFLAARHAKHETVFIQDDDVLVHNIPELAERYDGTRIIANLADDGSSWHWRWWQRYPQVHVELGFGSLIPKSWGDKLAEWPYEKDLLYREADKVFSVLHEWQAIRAGKKNLTRLYYRGQESGRDEHALSMQSEHKTLNREAIRKAQEWKSLRSSPHYSPEREC